MNLQATCAKNCQKVDDIINNFHAVTWAGIKYRKRQDARWGIVLNYLKIPFEYLTEPVKILGSFSNFLPDFWLPNQNCYFIVNQNLLYTNTERVDVSISYKNAAAQIKIWGVFYIYGSKPLFRLL